jgi:hypothetical protein
VAYPRFEEWVKRAINNENIDITNQDDMDSLLLCTKPSLKAIHYTKMKAFANHFRVNDAASNHMQIYDSGVASMFEVPTEDARDVSVHYAGVLKDILKLDYSLVHTPVTLLRCEWVKRQDNRGNPTYIRDKVGFLVVNFRHKLPRMLDPFIFPSQATQVFFSNETKKPRWKVVLPKEPRVRQEVVDRSDVFITTIVETRGLTTLDVVPALPTSTSLVGTIELSVEDNFLANVKY